MSHFVIESSIPVPTVQRAVYPFADMEIGDSFLLPIPDEPTPEKQAEALAELASKTRNAAYQYAKKRNAKLSVGEHAWHFMLRAVEHDTGAVDDQGNPIVVKAYRCWRVVRPERPAKPANEPAPATEQNAA